MLNIKVVARKFLMLSLTASFVLAPIAPAYAGPGVCRQFFEGPTVSHSTILFEEFAAEQQGKDAKMSEIQKLKQELQMMKNKNKSFTSPRDSEVRGSLAEFHLLLLTGDVDLAIAKYKNLFEVTESAFLEVKMYRAIIAKLKSGIAHKQIDHDKATVLIKEYELREKVSLEAYWQNHDVYYPLRMDLDRTLAQKKIQDPNAIYSEVKVQMLTVDKNIDEAQTALLLPGPLVGYNNAPTPGTTTTPLTPLQPLQPLVPAVHTPIIPIDAKVDTPVVKKDSDDDDDDDSGAAAANPDNNKPNNNAGLVLNGQQLQIPGIAPVPAPVATTAVTPAVPGAPAPVPAPAPAPVTVIPVPPPVVVVPPKALDATRALNTARQLDLAFGSYQEASYFVDSLKTPKKYLGEDFKIHRPALDEMLAFDRKESNSTELIMAKLNKELVAENKRYWMSFILQPEFFEALGSKVSNLPAPMVQPVSKMVYFPHDRLVKRRFMSSIIEILSVPSEGAGIDHLTRVETLFELNVRYPGDQLLVAYARVVRGARSWTDMKLTLQNEAYDKPYGTGQVEKQKKYADWVTRMTAAEAKANTLGDLSLREDVSPNYIFQTVLNAGYGAAAYYGGPKAYDFFAHTDFISWAQAVGAAAKAIF